MDSRNWSTLIELLESNLLGLTKLVAFLNNVNKLMRNGKSDL